jgi:hypothetical protein
MYAQEKIITVDWADDYQLEFVQAKVHFMRLMTTPADKDIY